MSNNDIGVNGGLESFQCIGVFEIKDKKQTRQEFGKLLEDVYNLVQSLKFSF